MCINNIYIMYVYIYIHIIYIYIHTHYIYYKYILYIYNKYTYHTYHICTHIYSITLSLSLSLYIYIYIYCSQNELVHLEICIFLELFILFLHTCLFPACCFRQRTYVAQGHMKGVPNEVRALSYRFVSLSLYIYKREREKERERERDTYKRI